MAAAAFFLFAAVVVGALTGGVLFLLVEDAVLRVVALDALVFGGEVEVEEVVVAGLFSLNIIFSVEASHNNFCLSFAFILKSMFFSFSFDKSVTLLNPFSIKICV